MITLFFIWTGLVTQLKLTIFGNSSWALLNKTPPQLINKSLEKFEIGSLDYEESEENAFLIKFTKTVLANFILIIFAISLSGYLLYENYSPLSYGLAFAVLYKDLILFGLFITWNSKKKDQTFFETISLIPSWAIKLDRFSALISAAIFGVLLWHRIPW